MNTVGNAFRISIFGESHGPLVGCCIDGLPAGIKPDFDLIRLDLKRRAPQKTCESTARNEDDGFEIVSGMVDDHTTGAPLTVLFRNSDAKSTDYAQKIARPSHADLTAYIKYGGFNDLRGGGMFSGRLTAPIVFCGALAKQVLDANGIKIVSHISNIGPIHDDAFDPLMSEIPDLDPFFPLIRRELKEEIEMLFSKVRSEGTSVGCSAECAVTGLKAGIGEPFFNSLESVISHLIFSVPGVHAIEFGKGFSLCEMFGNEANDAIMPDGRTITNHAGGINGGISNGMPLLFRVGFRPVPSIAMAQQSIDLETGESTTVSLRGRHDLCILPRGCAVVEACAAIAVLDLCMQAERSV